MNIENCTAIISGGASGLGEACARIITKNGGNASIVDMSEKKGSRLSEELGDKTIFCNTDVADEISLREAIDSTIAKFGEIHFVISCAGLATPGKVISKEKAMPIEVFNRIIQVNLIGTMNMIRLTAEKMIGNEANADGERGVIINTASIAAFEGQTGQAAYAASKAGVAGMTLPIAREFAKYGIRVVCIAPGLFNTPLMSGLPVNAIESLIQKTPFPKRLGKPEEFAALARHCIENPMINGETIRIDASIRMN